MGVDCNRDSLIVSVNTSTNCIATFCNIESGLTIALGIIYRKGNLNLPKFILGSFNFLIDLINNCHRICIQDYLKGDFMGCP